MKSFALVSFHLQLVLLAACCFALSASIGAPEQLHQFRLHLQQQQQQLSAAVPLFGEPHKEESHEEASHKEESHGKGGTISKEEHEKALEEHRELTTQAYALCLMCGVAVIMSLFYLVNWPFIKEPTWRALNMTVSIFCAVMIYNTVQDVFKYLLGMSQDHHFGHVALSFLLFVFFWCVLQGALFSIKGSGGGIPLHASGTLLAHLAGFGALHGLADLQFHKFWAASWGMNLAVPGIAFCVLLILNKIAAVGRDAMANADGIVDEEEKEWLDVVEDAEGDVLALSVGFATMQAVRFAFMGEPQEFEPDAAPHHATQAAADQLLAASIGFVVATFVAALALSKFGDALKDDSILKKAFASMPNVMSMAMAWCLLFWGDWQVSVWGFDSVRISEVMLLAIGMTVLVVVLIFVMEQVVHRADAMDRRAVRAVEVALGLMVGFSWERSFDLGLDSIHELLHDGQAAWVRHVMPLILLCLATPAWALYILPKTFETEKKEA